MIKTIALEFNLPMIMSYQFNRKGPGLANIGYSDAVGQLASIVIGIRDEVAVPTEFDERLRRRWKLVDLLKGREGETGVIRVLYDMARMYITQDRVVRGPRTYESPDWR